MDTGKDHFDRRCPRLGGTVSFGYCRTVGDTSEPCWKILDCWWEYFDVVAFLKENYASDTVDRIASTQAKPKIASLLEMIQQAKKNTAAGKKE